MKNIFFTAVSLNLFGLFVCPASYAQQISDPRWERWEAEMITDSTYVEGSGILEYFLYRVDASANETNFMKQASFHIAFMIYLEEAGFIIDYGSARVTTNNTNLSEDVKRLMARHGANVSVTAVPENNGALVIINLQYEPTRYDSITFNIYKIYYLIFTKNENNSRMLAH